MAKGTGVAVVPDCGVSPGLSNIIAVHFAKTHAADTIRVRCGGLPLVAPDESANPLRYKLVFSPWGLISEYSGGVPVIRGGKLASVEALGTIERFDDNLEASPTSNNSPQVIEMLRKCGVKDYNYMTLRYDGHWRLVQGWKTLGYLQGNVERDTELARMLSTDKILNYDPAKDRDRLSRAWEYKLDVAADTRTKFSAMELTTSWGGTIVAHHMVNGRGKPEGFATPERFVDTGWVIEEVERRLGQLRGG
jgi:saccharopine dehydrogenase-like NADP-dependent oxidoreductase